MSTREQAVLALGLVLGTLFGVCLVIAWEVMK
jgi:uncharacterized protein involved in exopolysaccharide biosynthesis